MDLKQQTIHLERPFIIDCGDIILREYQLEDLDAICELARQEEIRRYLPDWDVPREVRYDWMVHYEIKENEQFVKAVAEGGAVGDFRLRLVILDKNTKECIGWCCTGPKEELPFPNREIMYALSSRHTRKGYTSQAVQGLVKFLFDHTDAAELNGVARTDNPASNRVLQKSGFDQNGTIDIDGHKYVWYKIQK
ncbi:RimJ/RimL family protein N-acetyltransferase [Paenibacillus rhizosphaerae]|uniref:RimJ/RimL family protein N-acetyltransferase n=1 Tax=Paenibacillus rhizosphaerae TaxID=297318 RepID=A0A839TLA4_9BACL|nr:GNAT family N-acetyltransferase [Paenibacillus rhizosphaerae]MBB3127293.1 RimJ/RimL family protein N-acetyltransferase [Paenibacillus rhizosphaerae]